MTLNIELRLPDEYLDVLQQHVAATGENIDSYVSDLVADSLQIEVELSRRKPARQGTFADWLRQWADRHPRLDHEIDISRESIYAGCGE
jgi:hypothetical protein